MLRILNLYKQVNTLDNQSGVVCRQSKTWRTPCQSFLGGCTLLFSFLFVYLFVCFLMKKGLNV